MNIKEEAIKFIEERGWTQYQLAKAAGLHPVTLCRWLNNSKTETAAEKVLRVISEGNQLGSSPTGIQQ